MRKKFVIPLLITFLAACSHPTATVLPTPGGKSPTFTPTVTPMLRSSVTLSPVLTTDAPDQILFSPNGELVAKRYDYGRTPLEKPVIEISDKGGSLLWQIPYQGERPSGEHRMSLMIYRWTNDSSTLYFYYHQYTDGGGWAFWWDGADLQEIEIATGEVRRVLPGQGLMSFAISPAGTQVAYTRAQDTPGILFLRNLVSDTDTRILVQPEQQYTRVGGIHWSPSGKALVFQTEAELEENLIQVQTIYLDVVTLKQKVIKQYDIESMWLDGWNDERTLRFRSPGDDPIFLIDVITNEITIVDTATPSP